MLDKILQDVKDNKIDVQTAKALIGSSFISDLKHTCVDNMRNFTQGFGEVVYCEGKTKEQIEDIALAMVKNQTKNAMFTRLSEEKLSAVTTADNHAKYFKDAGIAVLNYEEPKEKIGNIAILCAGTSDIAVGEEACVTAEIMGNNVTKYYDVGVSGLHRLLNKIEDIRKANVVVAIAGMEGALPSVVKGLITAPLIAVPTSVGYGVTNGGQTALFAMLNSCSTGIAVVNIDNGFGAGYIASLINRVNI